MCGIAGIWGDASVDRLKAMADRLRHRGPDDDGAWSDRAAGVGLTYRRLAVIDLDGGQQPFTNEDGSVVSVCNGEIYNYRELRTGLLQRGHVLRSQSDTEVIVHLWEELGPDFVTKLRGMFAIALWDGRLRQLVLTRDRVGKKPLYFTEAGGELLFASEIKGLLAGLRRTPSIDEQAAADYLTFGVVPAPSTIYQGLCSVEPGERIILRDRRVASRNRYWHLQMLPKLEVSRGEAVERVDTALQEAVRLRLRSDVPIGCFLSGGIDSGIVTAIAAGQHARRLTTLTVGFDDDTFDERPLARQVAQRYDTDHHELVIRPDVVTDLPAIVRAYDQPYGDSSAIPSYYIAREARQRVKVVLNGDGGDEVFAGYRRYVGAWISQRIRRLDNDECRAWWRKVCRILPAPRGYRSPYAFLHRLARGMAVDSAARYLAWSVDGIDRRTMQALCNAGDAGFGNDGLTRAQSSDRLARVAMGPHRKCGAVDRMMGADFATMLPNDLLVKIDIATMAHGLEARSPLLDHELIDLVSRFPESVKLDGWTTKPLLRALSRRYLPKEIQRAPKRGFEVPLLQWLRGDLRELCQDVLLSRNGLPAQWFDRQALEKLLQGGVELDPARWGRWVWLLMMLGLWDAHVYRDRSADATNAADRM